jgi:hypothetical protein
MTWSCEHIESDKIWYKADIKDMIRTEIIFPKICIEIAGLLVLIKGVHALTTKYENGVEVGDGAMA